MCVPRDLYRGARETWSTSAIRKISPSTNSSSKRIGTRVFRPNYVTAGELQALITPILTPTVGKISVSSPAMTGIQADDTQTGGDALAGGDAVLVQDYVSVLAQIEQVVLEVDTLPAQVHIEAMIISVQLNDTCNGGVDFALLQKNSNLRLGLGAPTSSLANVSVDNNGLKFGILNSNVNSFVDALETVGDTNVIATPRLMVLNKQRAEILIGAQLGYVNTTVTPTSSTQSVQFLEVGTQLRIRPFISSDDRIRLEIHPELSTGRVKTEGGFTLPEKEVTKVTTNVMASNGCTVVIGGLLREDLENTKSQIPVLGDMPLLGAFVPP